MSDLRFDPVSNQWVTIARNRSERPMEFVPLEQTRHQLICPFCKGNEDETPGTCVAYREDGSRLNENDDPSSWTVRVIPNKYPSFELASRAGYGQNEVETDVGPYKAAQYPGEQELIIASPRHVASLSELTDEELHVSFAAYQERIKRLATLNHIEHAMLFMNCRLTAGASLSHVHTQLIGSPLISGLLQERNRRNRLHSQGHGKSLVESMTTWEREQGKRIVFESNNFSVFCPYASRFPFQTWIVPNHRMGHFQDCPEANRNELAELCRRLIKRLENLLGEPGYNMLLHQAPFSMSEQDHWYFEIFPRLTRAAGYEWGTDIWVNPVAPETAAKRVRVD
jgi:UDPglucose--hexose-1-phosphate uridylyltransferase